jgi:hypothetical protein
MIAHWIWLTKKSKQKKAGGWRSNVHITLTKKNVSQYTVQTRLFSFSIVAPVRVILRIADALFGRGAFVFFLLYTPNQHPHIYDLYRLL